MIVLLIITEAIEMHIELPVYHLDFVFIFYDGQRTLRNCVWKWICRNLVFVSGRTIYLQMITADPSM